jgi:hypothetical protein
MTDEQLATLNITQQVLRGLTLGLLAMHPEQAARVGAAIQAFAGGPGIEPMAAQMLRDLASGVDVIAGAREPRKN